MHWVLKSLTSSQVNLKLWHPYRTLLGDEPTYKMAYKAHRNFLTYKDSQ